ncbi:ArsB/NhaD family transporter [Fervidobacterium pennivorans subsp. shakshaketiis]|uniref:Na+/H+ antiporter NhaD-like permease n=1 Tax=Fervidobacterium pennivorans (strain DSM 9078 / Ven5) TaxID=771875 RepID=H9UBJ1_FERPD|nr:ArsB/NhaD family transporter [Fervidobacterium pennivorans]AFG34884.1 Na+/H+ antiporter NhaD-like permease [Fervidobacterium pennivorans DSM 9078]QIV78208.1 ArsB/NhaD family transporter [Fervidobacterium pennivorans subsp. keratinolyticus]
MKLVVALTFSLVLYFVVTGKLNKTIAAMVGGLTLLAIRVFPDPYEGLKESIDINTLLFLIGMMIFVRVMETSGIFEYIAIKTVKIAGTSLPKLFFAMTFVVAFVSAFIDNVTTILIFVPVTFAIGDILNIDPIPFVLGEIFASNIGGTMTPIGDPPNILITSAAKIPFTEFIKYMIPVNLIILFLTDVSLVVIFRKEFNRQFSREFLDGFDESKVIKSRRRFVIASGFMFFVIFLFLLQKPLKLESSIIGLIAGFFGLLIFEPQEITPFLEKVEWEVIFFFLGLFIITGAMEKVGIMKDIANFLVKISSGSMVTLSSVIVWASGILSGFVDNIPFTATMIPVIKGLPAISPQFSNITPLWYALALGACLGGNLTPVGASANVVGLTLTKKYKGKEITFRNFIKYSFFVVFISLAVSNVYSLILLKIL